jgi:hypothetical protein
MVFHPIWARTVSPTPFGPKQVYDGKMGASEVRHAVGNLANNQKAGL